MADTLTTTTQVDPAVSTFYDRVLLKAAEKGMRIEGIRLVSKEGGKSGTFKADP